jgi:hypothetical protein
MCCVGIRTLRKAMQSKDERKAHSFTPMGLFCLSTEHALIFEIIDLTKGQKSIAVCIIAF